jgi:hypothetical protein
VAIAEYGQLDALGLAERVRRCQVLDQKGHARARGQLGSRPQIHADAPGS